SSLAQTPGSLPGGDVRAGPVLEDALGAGVIERREQREVAGRRCQVYRSKDTAAGATLAPATDPTRQHADTCIDEAGVVLEEVVVTDGHQSRRRLATSG